MRAPRECDGIGGERRAARVRARVHADVAKVAAKLLLKLRAQRRGERISGVGRTRGAFDLRRLDLLLLTRLRPFELRLGLAHFEVPLSMAGAMQSFEGELAHGSSPREC